MCVCMCACVCVHVWGGSMYVHKCLLMNSSVVMCVYARVGMFCLHMFICVCASVCKYTKHTLVWSCACMSVNMHFMQVLFCMYMWCICMCVCLFTCMSVSLCICSCIGLKLVLDVLLDCLSIYVQRQGLLFILKCKTLFWNLTHQADNRLVKLELPG